MLRVMIVDDEPLALRRLGRILSEFEHVEVCGAFLDPAAAYEYAETNRLDAAFLDVEMPQINGMKLAEALRELSGELEIVMVTGYDQYAVGAYDRDVLDYIVKPVTAERLARSIDRVGRRLNRTPPVRSRRLSIRMLGGLSIEGQGSAGTPIKLRTPKTEELLAYLVCRKTVGREEVADALWRDLSLEKALKNLNSTLYYIRRAIGGEYEPVIVSNRNGISVQENALDCDLYEFERLLRRMKNPLEREAGLFERMDALYAGKLLQGRAYEWAEDEARRLELGYMEMMETAARYYAESGQQTHALRYYDRILQTDEIREDIHREVILLHLAQGRKAAAISHYRLLEELLHRELGAKPDPGIGKLLES